MEEPKRTNKILLAQGVKTLVMSLGAIAAGPIITYNAFMNKDHQLFEIVLGVGIILMLLAIFLIAKGLNTILKSFFD